MWKNLHWECVWVTIMLKLRLRVDLRREMIFRRELRLRIDYILQSG